MSIVNEQIIAYVHHMMPTSEREAFETRLREDATLRDAVATERAVMQQIVGGVSAEIGQQAPPSKMTFAAIAPNIQQRRRQPRWLESLTASLVATIALAVILFAVAVILPERQRNDAAPAINIIEVAPTDWSQTPVLSNTLSVQPRLTQTVTPTLGTKTPQDLNEHPTIPTRVPTIDVSNP